MSKLVGTIAIVTIASCDNIGVFVPYFVTLSVTNLLITLFVFLILILSLFTTQNNIPGVGEIVEKFGRWFHYLYSFRFIYHYRK